MKHVKVIIKVETEVTFDRDNFLIKEQPLAYNSLVSVYITDEDVSCFVGKVENKRELFDLVGPKNLKRTINDIATEYQWDSLSQSLLYFNDIYYIDNKAYVALPYKEN